MRPHGWVDLPPAEVVARIKATAAMLGARWQTQAEIEKDAECVVAEITRQVETARQNGGLKQVNMDYKKYRQAQIANSETAIGYSAYLLNFTRLLVVRAAQKSMMQTP
jgi:thiamine pyrophosphate-dependent acetolactate synthase large subunit-like protein